jgi:hypothetical protein
MTGGSPDDARDGEGGPGGAGPAGAAPMGGLPVAALLAFAEGWHPGDPPPAGTSWRSEADYLAAYERVRAEYLRAWPRADRIPAAEALRRSMRGGPIGPGTSGGGGPP